MSNNYIYPSLQSNTGNTSSNEQSSDFTRTVLYGKDINSCKVPDHTTLKQNEPMVVFHNDTHTEKFGLSKTVLSKHLLLMGGIGSGKTNTIYFLIRDLLKQITTDDLVLIFDSKGDFYGKFYSPWTSDHLVIGNHEEYSSNTRYWNVFDELRNSAGTFDKTSELAAKEIAKTLFSGRESQSQPFFSQAATDVVSKVLVDFIRHRPPKELNNASLVAFFRGANVNSYHSMIDRNPDFESARDYFGQKGTNLTAQALGVMSYVTTMVNDIFIGIFGEGKDARTFSMRQLVRQKGAKVVFVEYDINAGEILGPIYGLLYDLALKEALGGRKHQGSVYLICDEFRILPKLSHINDALNLGRSLGVKVIAGLQTINQLYDVYGEDLGKTLAAGFMNSMCFQTWDLDSRKFISDRFGDNYINLFFHSMSEPIHTQRDGHVVEDWDILKLRVGEAFVNLTGEGSFRFRFEEYK